MSLNQSKTRYLGSNRKRKEQRNRNGLSSFSQTDTQNDASTLSTFERLYSTSSAGNNGHSSKLPLLRQEGKKRKQTSLLGFFVKEDASSSIPSSLDNGDTDQVTSQRRTGVDEKNKHPSKRPPSSSLKNIISIRRNFSSSINNNKTLPDNTSKSSLMETYYNETKRKRKKSFDALSETILNKKAASSDATISTHHDLALKVTSNTKLTSSFDIMKSFLNTVTNEMCQMPETSTTCINDNDKMNEENISKKKRSMGLKKKQLMFIDNHKKTASSSLVWQMYRREIMGHRTSTKRRIPINKKKPRSSSSNIIHQKYRSTIQDQTTNVTSIPNKYHPISYVQFSEHKSLIGAVNNSDIITACSWDPFHADLLAVATKRGTVCLYDVHDISLAARARPTTINPSTTCTTKNNIEPVLQFRTTVNTRSNRHRSNLNNSQQANNHVTILKWNPFNPNELIIGFEHSNQIHVYNIEDENMSSSYTIYQNNTHSHDWKEGTSSLVVSRRQSSNTSNQPDVNIYVGGKYGTLSCFHHKSIDIENSKHNKEHYQKKKNSTSKKCQWSLCSKQWTNTNNKSIDRKNYSEGVSELISLSQSKLLLVGGTRGTIVLLDAQHLIRTSFSSMASPQILSSYSLSHLLAMGNDKVTNPFPLHPSTLSKQPNMYSIQTMSLLGDNVDNCNKTKSPLFHQPTTNQTTKSYKKVNIILPPLLVVTQCGWVYSLSNLGYKCNDDDNKINNNIDSGKSIADLELWHRTNRIKYYTQRNQERLIVGEHQYLYSVPNITPPSSKMMGDWYCFANVPQSYQQVSAIQEQQPIMNIAKNHQDLLSLVNKIKGSNNDPSNSTKNVYDQNNITIDNTTTVEHDSSRNDEMKSLSIEETRRNYILINKAHENKYRVNLPDDIMNSKNSHSIRTIAVHPEEEWIIASAGAKLYLLRQG